MLNDSQLTEIRNYLLTKKLPIDILIEVQDHFVSQISSIQQEENLDFEMAFARVKESWRKELTLSWKGEMSLIDSTDFMRKMQKKIIYTDLKTTVFVLIPYIVILFLIANFTSSIVFKIVFIFLFFIPTIVSLFNFIYHFKSFKILKKYPDHALTLQQDGIMYFIFALPPFAGFFVDMIEEPQKFQTMFLFNFEFFDALKVLLIFVFLLYVLGGAVYSLICQNKLLKQIEIVKPFLKYLEKTA